MRARIAHAPAWMIHGKVIAMVAKEAPLHDPHARQVEVIPQSMNGGRDFAEIFRNEWKITEFLLQHFEE